MRAVAPDVEAVRDVLGGEEPGGLLGRASTDVGFAGDQDPLVRPDAVEEPLIVESGQEMRRTEQVGVVSKRPINRARRRSRPREQGREYRGMPQPW